MLLLLLLRLLVLRLLGAVAAGEGEGRARPGKRRPPQALVIVVVVVVGASVMSGPVLSTISHPFLLFVASTYLREAERAPSPAVHHAEEQGQGAAACSQHGVEGVVCVCVCGVCVGASGRTEWADIIKGKRAHTSSRWLVHGRDGDGSGGGG
jgi:hypothetical protein